MFFRKALLSDLEEMQKLFAETIQSVCKSDYNSEQIKVWVSGAKNKERWLDVINTQFIELAIIDNKIVGFGTLKNENYIDLLFIHKDFQRQGIADKIINKLEFEAKKNHSKFITSDVSITAKPFFEKKGYIVKAEQKNILKGVEIINYKMEKVLF
ncbi:GNAT family N-acetyltransferase [Flavobacterium sp.]|uniref:GNAT family N-acetyltransferase n=1 Tax=Flavobacterium sp. TaxID=239 RepID=UPI0031D5461C